MPIAVECEQCQARYQIDDRFAGKRAKCKRCGQVMPIPLAPALSSGGGDNSAPATTLTGSAGALRGTGGAGAVSETGGAGAANRAGSISGTGGAHVDVAPGPDPGLAPAPKGWRVEDVVIEREDDAAGVPLRKSSKPAASAGPPGGGLALALILTFVGAVLLLAMKDQAGVAGRSSGEAEELAAGSVRVWGGAVMRLATFFAVVGPLTMAGFILASRMRGFPLMKPAYLRATAVAALPVTLFLLVDALSPAGLTDRFVFVLFILAAGGLTFYAVRVLFQLEPMSGLVSTACGLVTGLIGFAGAWWLTTLIVSMVPAPPEGPTRIAEASDDPTVARRPGSGPAAATTRLAAPAAPGVTPPPEARPPEARPPGSSPSEPRTLEPRPPEPLPPEPRPRQAPQDARARAAAPAAPAIEAQPRASNPSTEGVEPNPAEPPPRRRVTLFGDDSEPAVEPLDPAAEFAARVREAAGPLARKVTGIPLPAGAETILGALAPSRTFAIVSRDNPGQQTVELWTGRPPARKGGGTFKVEPPFAVNYAISPDGSGLIRVVTSPKLSARAWSTEGDRDVSAMDLDGGLGRPRLLGYLGGGGGAGGNGFLICWAKGTRYTLEVWDAKTETSRRHIPLPGHEPTTANEAVSPDGRLFAHTVRSRGQNQLVLHNLAEEGEPRRLPFVGQDEQSLTGPAGIAFSPDSTRVAALFVTEGDGLVVTWDVRSGKPIRKIIVPTAVWPLRSLTDEPVRSLDWIAGGRAWLLCGTAMVDASSGALLADLDATNVIAQAVGEANVIRLAFAEHDKPGAVVVIELDPTQLLASASTPNPARPRAAGRQR